MKPVPPPEAGRDTKPPAVATLRKYGLSVQDWFWLFDLQGGCCPICLRSGIPLNVDHKHVPNWKKLPKQHKRHLVRALVCIRCNGRILGATKWGATAYMLRRAAHYLEETERRINDWESPWGPPEKPDDDEDDGPLEGQRQPP